jgi:hypothetical protein
MERVSWEGFMEMERRQLRERREGKLRAALGIPLAGESLEQLNRIGAQDRRRAAQGLVAVIGQGGRISHKHIDDLSRLDMNSRTAAERGIVGWLKERVDRRKRGADMPPVPHHLLG